LTVLKVLQSNSFCAGRSAAISLAVNTIFFNYLAEFYPVAIDVPLSSVKEEVHPWQMQFPITRSAKSSGSLLGFHALSPNRSKLGNALALGVVGT
jgi:hypothetical protein